MQKDKKTWMKLKFHESLLEQIYIFVLNVGTNYLGTWFEIKIISNGNTKQPTNSKIKIESGSVYGQSELQKSQTTDVQWYIGVTKSHWL